MTELSYSQDDEGDIRELLMGRRVIAVETTPFGGTMVLDDGRVVRIVPNSGCGGCSAGNYDLESLSRVDNIITRVDFEETNDGDDVWEGNTTYRIFVFADNEKINLLSVEGTDGNGYYGTGYELVVVG